MSAFDTDAAEDALVNRKLGRAATGQVEVRDFDEGVVLTLGAVLSETDIDCVENGKVVKHLRGSNYFIPIDGVTPSPGFPGVPVTFAYPEDVYEPYRLPAIVVRRDEINPATTRWHPGTLQYRAPSPGAPAVTVSSGDPGNPTLTTGVTRMEELQQAAPFDITYTISLLGRSRGVGRGIAAGTSRGEANKILRHVLKIYQPYCTVFVRDSIGDLRTYSGFMSGIAMLDDVFDIAERVIGYALSLRVEAELDLLDPETVPTAYSRAVRAVRKTL